MISKIDKRVLIASSGFTETVSTMFIMSVHNVQNLLCYVNIHYSRDWQMDVLASIDVLRWEKNTFPPQS